MPRSSSTGVYVVAKFDEPGRSAKEWAALRGLSTLAPSRFLVTPHDKNKSQDGVIIFPAVPALAQYKKCESLLHLCRIRVVNNPQDCVIALRKLLATLGAEFYKREPGAASFASEGRLSRWESVYPNLATRGVRSDILANASTNWREKDWEKAPTFDILGRDGQHSLPNPFHSLLSDLQGHTGQVIRSRIHGDLNLTNVIVSLRSNREIDETFVIDLANSQPNRVLAMDFARLEAEIWRNVFTWSQTKERSPSQDTLLEEFVDIREFLDGMVEKLPTRLSKRARGCAMLVNELRQIGRSYLKTDTAYLLGDYMECLCFTSLELLKHYDVLSSTTTSKVLILSAALCRRFLNDVQRGYFIKKSNVPRWGPPRSLDVTASRLRTERDHDTGGQDFERRRVRNVEGRRMARFHLGGIPPRRRLFGRTDDLKAIDRELAEHGTNVLCIYAEGGAGKSQLVHDWVWRKAQSNKTNEVFCFSFNSQGASEKRQTSSNAFFRQLFGWLGLKAKGHLTSDQRIEELANVIFDRRLILYLDGIEPLQTHPDDGGAPLKDTAVRGFLDRLAVSGGHFIIITTRYRIKNLAPSTHLEQIELLELSADAAVQLLKTEHKVWGEDESQLIEAVKKWRCHALTIDLLGSYLRAYCAGDIRGSDTIGKRYKPTNGHYRPTQMLRGLRRSAWAFGQTTAPTSGAFRSPRRRRNTLEAQRATDSVH